MKRAPLVALAALSLVGCSKSSEAPAPPPPAASSAPVASASASAAPAADPIAALTTGPVVRDQEKVTVDGVVETWRLEWVRAPLPDCVSEDWDTCACAGFAFGEKGDLDLVRARPGEKEDRMHLGPLFEDRDARLRRWPVTPADKNAAPKIAELVTRPVVDAIKLADYDHDGRATELVLQVAAGPCGHTPAVVVGISKKDPKLHAFAAKGETTPLSLGPDAWEKLKTAKGPLRVVEIACGDHAAEEEQTVEVTAQDGEIVAERSTRRCK